MNLTLIPLVLIGIAAVFTFLKIGNVLEQRKFKLSSLINSNKEDIKPNRKLDKVKSWITPSITVKEAQNLGFEFTIKHYTRDYLIGFLLSIAVLYVLYRNIPITIMGATIGGLILPNTKIYRFKRKYEDKVKASIISYFKRFSSTLRSYDFNVSKSLEDIISTVDPSIKSDLENVLFDLQQGVNFESAIKEFDKKYKWKGVKLFHDMVVLVSNMGSDEQNLLRSSANKFARKKYWQNKLVTQNAKFVRDSSAIGILSILIFVSIMVMSNEFYLNFVNSIIGKATITLAIVSYVITFININKTANVDPTETR